NPITMPKDILALYLETLKQAIPIDFKDRALSDEQIETLGKNALKAIFDDHLDQLHGV
ncbi:MAG: hypothetical protein JSR46_09490, partial [Verrucomicrobia bacterium]|nr:hypothetical protein [Verrucomicrobiota bacterium]